MITVAVINQKGGVGKTTTTVNLGAGLARLGKRVVLLDFDPQGNLTAHLEPDRSDARGTTYELLRGGMALRDTILPTREENLFVVPAGDDLDGIELELASEIGRETILRDRVEQAIQNGLDADYLLIDCPPSLGLLSLNALTAADEVLVPIQAEFFALQGMARFVEVQSVVQSRLNARLRLGGIVICMWKGQANLSREVRDEVDRVFGDVLFTTVVRQNVKLAEAPSAARTIFDYAPDSNGAADYAAFTIEFLRRHHQEVPTDASDRLFAVSPEGNSHNFHKPAALTTDETGVGPESATAVDPVSAPTSAEGGAPGPV